MSETGKPMWMHTYLVVIHLLGGDWFWWEREVRVCHLQVLSTQFCPTLYEGPNSPFMSLFFVIQTSHKLFKQRQIYCEMDQPLSPFQDPVDVFM